jgi:hypothetical protein
VGRRRRFRLPLPCNPPTKTAPFGAVFTWLYAVNELPQPQPPVAFGFLKVKPAPIMVVT